MTTPLFLSATELRELTGYALKVRQIAQLRTMGIAFRINGCGRPVVTRAAVEGVREQPGAQLPAWKPALLRFERKAA